jgi:hypothetical protein
VLALADVSQRVDVITILVCNHSAHIPERLDNSMHVRQHGVLTYLHTVQYALLAQM